MITAHGLGVLRAKAKVANDFLRITSPRYPAQHSQIVGKVVSVVEG
jgi:hypothetical protein